MWSRKSRPVDTSARPRPSRSTVAFSCVSLLLRETEPLLLKPHLYRMGMRAESLELGQPHGGVAQGFQVSAVQAEHARALEKGMNAEGGCKTRRPGRRQRVAGTGGVVAKRHRRVRSDED